MDAKTKKVLDGLRCCLSEEYMLISDNSKHGECPYRNIKFGCIVRLHKDAFEVLNNKEVSCGE